MLQGGRPSEEVLELLLGDELSQVGHEQRGAGWRSRCGSRRRGGADRWRERRAGDQVRGRHGRVHRSCTASQRRVWQGVRHRQRRRQLRMEGRVHESRSVQGSGDGHFSVGERVVWPAVVGPRQQGSADFLSRDRVQECRVRGRGGRRLLFRFANLCVALGELEPDGLWKVGVEPHALLKLLLGGFCTSSRGKCYKTYGRRCLSILLCDFQQRSFISLVGTE